MIESMIGRYVRSLAGRGQGRVYAVIAIADENHVMIADGRHRKQSNPKKKKLKHIEVLEGSVTLPCTDKQLWAQINNFDLS